MLSHLLLCYYQIVNIMGSRSHFCTHCHSDCISLYFLPVLLGSEFTEFMLIQTPKLGVHHKLVSLTRNLLLLQFVIASLTGWGLVFYGGYKLFSGGKKEKKEEVHFLLLNKCFGIFCSY